MNRDRLERYQVLLYLFAVAAGLAVAARVPGAVSALDRLLWPLLAVLLYATFTQVPIVRLRAAFADTRFLAAAAIGNFLVLPLLAWALLAIVPDHPAIRLGVLMVLLVPCTDWFITFTHLGGGDTRRAIAFAPVSLLLQILLLPVYLWLFAGTDAVVAVAHREVVLAFFGLIVLPLLAAFATELLARERPRATAFVEGLGWLPVPLLALVVFVVAASQAATVTGHAVTLLGVVPAFVAFLLIAAALARLFAHALRLGPQRGRVLAFSFATRNSFVVLPLALALPASYELAALVIVMQSLVELVGMALFLWWVPNRLFPCPSPAS